MTIARWTKRLANSKPHKYKEFVPAICKNNLMHRLLQLQKKQLEEDHLKCPNQVIIAQWPLN